LGLLKNAKRFTRILQTASPQGTFDKAAKLLSNLLHGDVYIVDTQGKIIGFFIPATSKSTIEAHLAKRKLPNVYVDFLNKTTHNLYNLTPCESGSIACLGEVAKDHHTTLLPIALYNQRLGTLLLSHFKTKLDEDSLVLLEFALQCFGFNLLHLSADKGRSQEGNKDHIRLALKALSYSELTAAEHVFGELTGLEGHLVASKIADRAGITRSVIVNALRKLEGAGMLESRSLGMKGTYIKILNPELFGALEQVLH
jgi:transcriptional pleiotropic repressor